MRRTHLEAGEEEVGELGEVCDEQLLVGLVQQRLLDDELAVEPVAVAQLERERDLQRSQQREQHDRGVLHGAAAWLRAGYARCLCPAAPAGL